VEHYTVPYWWKTVNHATKNDVTCLLDSIESRLLYHVRQSLASLLYCTGTVIGELECGENKPATPPAIHSFIFDDEGMPCDAMLAACHCRGIRCYSMPYSTNQAKRAMPFVCGVRATQADDSIRLIQGFDSTIYERIVVSWVGGVI
jgi:hypothetical protein